MSAAVPPEAAHEAVRLSARARTPACYIAALLAPRETRDDLMALAAFTGEVAAVTSLASEPAIARIRLQWWRDALLSRAITGHPVADAAIALIGRGSLDAALAVAIVDAHQDAASALPFADDTSLMAHLAATDGASLAAACRIVAKSRPPPALIGEGGSALGLSRLLLDVPRALRRGRLLLPEARLRAAGCDPEAILAGTAHAALGTVLRDLVAQARQSLAKIRRDFRVEPAAIRAVLSPLALTEPNLRALEAPETEPGDVADLRPGDLARQWWAMRTGRL